MTQINISLDLETWGTTPGSDIRSIGACVFDPATGDIPCYDGARNEYRSLNGAFYIACDNPHRSGISDDILAKAPGIETGTERKYPLTRDPQTVQWWSEQSPEAQAAFTNPVDLRDALIKFGVWLRQCAGSIYDQCGIGKPDDTIRLWSHGAAFDPPILAAAYAAVGLPVPWHYRAPRDTRTAFDMAGIDDHSACFCNHATGTYHHALDDAICQAKAVCGAFDVVQQWHRHSGIS